MGITGELVRSVFSKNRSFGTPHDTNVMRNNSVERKRWSSVRSYLCGDEFNSVLAEEDSASRRFSNSAISSVFLEDFSGSGRTSKATVFSSRIDDGSEATVTQPISENSNETLDDYRNTNSVGEHDAAVIIQSAFRSFLARNRYDRDESVNAGDLEVAAPTGSPGKESIATSVEVQTGNSVVEEVKEGGSSFSHRMPSHKGAKVQVSKLKQDDWDDSTVSSNISKMRIQNRLEASTRRERALAYAFSQQLRICSKKKQNVRSGNDSETNMSWSWLERWMATRQHDTNVLKTGEEKESCGSNEVSMQFDNVSLSSKTAEKSYYQPTRSRLKATRQKSSPGYKEYSKMNRQGGGRKVRCEDQE
ncbi:hypothetical protein LXL04_038044 [Taraxacum kok-saghyz]